ncbi:MAG: glycosyl hydrolase family 18 [Cutibacterium sp.]|jgi:GH18 family chitinase|uniref:glycosyl hydrolase family 18 protein n=1 Tax=Cutibacterium sp. TaxID=1912221 RepID=UPI00258BAE3B|nr:glycosyl hydrolase family 18 protein [Cutibacterium sp.]MCA3766272.1 glycosyl hydrolase family 18 [Cutibacterium sp.]
MPTDHRIVAYHQTHGHGDTFVDLSPLGASAPLTHLIVAALHIADDGTVILNDHPVDDDYHTQLWDQLDAVRSRGVRVLAMVGGWAPGTMCKLDGESLSIYYPGLRDFLTQRHFDGIDIDVEQEMSLPGVCTLIERFRSDFDEDFEIVLAPVASALHGGANLSGFDYQELHQLRGDDIDFYNAQFYSGFGSLASPDDYVSIVEHSIIPVNKIVTGMAGSPDAAQGFVDMATVSDTISTLCQRYPNFGGVDVWEYPLALPGAPDHPDQWVHVMHHAMSHR